ncbi:MAG: hypothetical protein EXR72_13965 [Myxococcales bacterium]|nr:hypothetical protein [Myxococcales bacterium]
MEGSINVGGARPRGLDVRGDDDDRVYFTGTTRQGIPAVFRSVGGDDARVLYRGAPLRAPDAVAAARGGDVFVTDTPDVPGAGRVLRISNGRVHELASGLWLGSPAGVALTLDERTLLVSGLDDSGHSLVYLIDLASGAVSTFNDVIGANTTSGGLHRAARADVFSWADSSSPDRGGRVYRIAF